MVITEEQYNRYLIKINNYINYIVRHRYDLENEIFLEQCEYELLQEKYEILKRIELSIIMNRGKDLVKENWIITYINELTNLLSKKYQTAIKNNTKDIFNEENDIIFMLKSEIVMMQNVLKKQVNFEDYIECEFEKCRLQLKDAKPINNQLKKDRKIVDKYIKKEKLAIKERDYVSKLFIDQEEIKVSKLLKKKIIL